MSTTTRVVIEIEGHIAHVHLSRPQVHNALDFAMFEQLIDAAKTIRRDTRIRAVVLSGDGPSFCAGLDFKSVKKQPSIAAKIFLKWPWSKTNIAQKTANCWRDLPVPVLAAIHGNCFGGGLQIALGADIRFCAPDASLSVMEIRWGIIPDMSGTLALSKLTRYDVAQELTMTGRVINGTTAHELGLVSHLSQSPQADALALAEELVEKSPDALAGTKLLFRKTWQSGNWLALGWERWVQMRLLGRANQIIAMKNGLEKENTQPFKNRSRWW
ncbi:MAG: crotonase/enoyl-CoA hydratase family protein [Granulosicoccaceae bacterium]